MQRDLVIRATSGDHDAFSELACAAVGGITRVAFLILRDPDLASDAAQEALIGAWRDIRALRDPDRFDAWLYRLTVRACYRAARHQRRKSTMEVELLPSHDAFVDDDQRLLAIRDQLERGFRRLSPDERGVLVLRYYLDLPLADAAAVLGIPIGTMKSRLNRASAALRAAIDAHERSTALANGGAA